jgi:hypothetical protein
VCPRRETLTHYSSCSGETNTDSIKSALRHITPNFYFLHPLGSVGHVVLFGASGPRNVDALFFMLRWDRDTLHQPCGLSSDGIYGSPSAFWCIWSMKHRLTIFHALVGPLHTAQKSTLGHVTPNLCVCI